VWLGQAAFEHRECVAYVIESFERFVDKLLDLVRLLDCGLGHTLALPRWALAKLELGPAPPSAAGLPAREQAAEVLAEHEPAVLGGHERAVRAHHLE